VPQRLLNQQRPNLEAGFLTLLRIANIDAWQETRLLGWRKSLLDVGDAEAHLTLKLLWVLFAGFADRPTTPQAIARPTRLPLLIGKQTRLTDLFRGNKLIVH
jgi:hypothetical protein